MFWEKVRLLIYEREVVIKQFLGREEYNNIMFYIIASLFLLPIDIIVEVMIYVDNYITREIKRGMIKYE